MRINDEAPEQPENSSIKWQNANSSIEIRTQGHLEGGSAALDEIVADGATFHLEQMNHDAWWVGIEAGGKYFHLNFSLDQDGRLQVYLSDQDDEGNEWEGDNRPRE